MFSFLKNFKQGVGKIPELSPKQLKTDFRFSMDLQKHFYRHGLYLLTEEELIELNQRLAPEKGSAAAS